MGQRDEITEVAQVVAPGVARSRFDRAVRGERAKDVAHVVADAAVHRRKQAQAQARRGVGQPQLGGDGRYACEPDRQPQEDVCRYGRTSSDSRAFRAEAPASWPLLDGRSEALPFGFLAVAAGLA